MNPENKVYRAAIYVRLSKEDGDVTISNDKVESDSISNQRELIKEYLKSKPEIRVCSERVDDGYSGVDFNRPAFQLMIQDVKENKIDCIVVKDLSRLGRNYIEVGKYVQNIFPVLGVRFIAINDNYDSFAAKSQTDDIIIPFKNLINDAYSRDISIKIRSNLEVKRKKGEFIGSFVAYGYMKSDVIRNKIIVDEYAGKIVRDIFEWKKEGMSQQAISDKLNRMGILSPMEYKQANGLNFATSFKVNSQAKWSSQTIGRILRNEIYTGVLIQGKKTTPNYKIKKVVCKDEEDWIRIEDSHEALVSRRDFNIVQSILDADTRTAPNEDAVYLFAGMIECADCHGTMIRKTVPAGSRREGTERKYIYYVCAENKNNKTCSSHTINEKQLEEVVLLSIRTHITAVMDLERTLNFVKSYPIGKLCIKKLDARIMQNEQEIDKCNKLKVSIYEDMREGLISKEEFVQLKDEFQSRVDEATRAVGKLEQEIETILSNKSETQEWIECFKEHSSISHLTRQVVIGLIHKIYVYEDNRVFIRFRYQDKFDYASVYVTKAKEAIDLGNEQKEAI